MYASMHSFIDPFILRSVILFYGHSFQRHVIFPSFLMLYYCVGSENIFPAVGLIQLQFYGFLSWFVIIVFYLFYLCFCHGLLLLDLFYKMLNLFVVYIPFACQTNEHTNTHTRTHAHTQRNSCVNMCVIVCDVIVCVCVRLCLSVCMSVKHTHTHPHT